MQLIRCKTVLSDQEKNNLLALLAKPNDAGLLRPIDQDTYHIWQIANRKLPTRIVFSQEMRTLVETSLKIRMIKCGLYRGTFTAIGSYPRTCKGQYRSSLPLCTCIALYMLFCIRSGSTHSKCPLLEEGWSSVVTRFRCLAATPTLMGLESLDLEARSVPICVPLGVQLS